ncbi:hypothetical protein MTR_4g024010 [Medicago truncatula]|uniref:Uncharacterized protein n=1 Tax=Medicago truncatula TaxID=3880 RepID=G7JEK4_MEDTR|nr:hypothetical protein MTR_4g024010 [Medicago truncatula]
MLNLKEKGRENTGVYSGFPNRPYYRVNYKDSFSLWLKPILNLLCKDKKVEYRKRMQDLMKKEKENKFVECQQVGTKRIKQKTKWKADNMVG